MNTNSFFNQTAAISVPNGSQGSSLSQPIDIAYQRSGSVFNNNGGFQIPQQPNQQQHQQQQSQNQNQQSQQHQNLNHQGHNQNHQNSNYLSTNSINININPNNQRSFRRDSIAHSQGVGGISWGSVTIGSWLKDEVLMHNNFNLSNQNQSNQISMSPPIQSAYLPDLEANYCKDYSCCGQLLPTLHDLLKHYEESHISPTPPTHQPKPIQNFDTVSTTDVFINSNNQNQQQHHHNHNQHQHQHNNNNNNHNNNHVNGIKNQQTFGFNQTPFQQQNIQQQLRQQLQGGGNNSNGNHHHHQQQHNNHQQHHNNQNFHQSQQQINLQDSQFNNQSSSNQHSTPFPMSLSNDDSAMDLDEEMDEGYIDDPSRNLYVAQGNEKPFTCPVIGCNKTYKNQNGLKYHRLHGHQNQKLHLNPDGTYSVIDPNDGNGMEQDKPYRCEVCGKRYKNLNGLKYHRGHSTH